MDKRGEIETVTNAPTRKPLTLKEKLQLIDTMCGCTAGGPSGGDILLEDRRREDELETRKNGW